MLLKSGGINLSFTPDWPLIGVLLIFLGLLVRFEVRVMSSDASDQVKGKEKTN